MAIRVLAEIKPAGDFPVMSAENVIVSGKMLDVVLNEKANSVDVANALSGKVEKESGKGLSENDYSNAEKAKVKQAGDDITRLNGYFTLV